LSFGLRVTFKNETLHLGVDLVQPVLDEAVDDVVFDKGFFADVLQN
jgi:hypothetical protein